MKLVTTREGQSLMDIAIQEYGTLEAMFTIMEDNPDIDNVTKYLAAGTVVIIRENSSLMNLPVAGEIRKKGILPATAGDPLPGIGNMIIEDNFEVQ